MIDIDQPVTALYSIDCSKHFLYDPKTTNPGNVLFMTSSKKTLPANENVTSLHMRYYCVVQALKKTERYCREVGITPGGFLSV